MSGLNILLTSVGRRGYLVKYFKEALNGEGKVHVSNSSDISPAFQYADASVVTPLIYDGAYIPFLIQYCQENEIKALISLFDVDLPVLAQHKKQFDEIGVKVIVSDVEVVQICNDKWKTYQFLNNNGFYTPKTFINLDEAISSIEKGIISYPVIIKPRWGMGSIAVFEAENENELKVFYEKTKRSIQKTYLKYEAFGNIEESVLIQEKLPGEEFGLDVVNDLEGNYQNTVVKKKYAMRSGETDCAVTVNNEQLKKTGEKLSSQLRHIANLDVDVFWIDEQAYVLELNARFGGGYPFSHMAGVNLPSAIVKWIRAEKIDKDILQEKFNVMSHKDINLVRIR